MLSLRKPSLETVSRFLARQARLDFSYGAVGATATTPPAGYTVDRYRVTLGAGEQVFLAARSAIMRWEQFQLGWLEAVPNTTPLRDGETAGIVVQIFGVYWMNAARIVYTIDEPGPLNRFGFAYGTLPGHAETGEERFTVEWNHETNEVAYDILAFSRPRHPLARLGFPLVRRMQKRFASDSCAAMRRVVSGRQA